ncbi:50S rRNA methyltransferase [bacterium (Candidatus Gribaldobacteria) CG08_land_8_20_14_0_20_39_15]|uniref:Ribosomal RNA large subunit methyltransferase E n=1 Tax=bacterium (Candidatus Gribaldobacteria) CG08_land_8_20_14_0_20_39_15 TaxID=2014273 RepID=A0A2M6XVI0_9BACT|nr:MAG: 50S rRNA methyltransferase [bacterium (Candidatus Gribaldobacteria) CG08_land_8_20_14_0_20_39_15]
MKFDLSKEDFYTQKAKEEGYPARSVYKLKEIDEKFRIFKNSDRVLDLGATPGSWLLYISKKIGSAGQVVAVDMEDLKIETPFNSVFIKKTVFDDDFFDALIRCCHPEAKPKDLSRDSSLSLRMTECTPIFDAVVSDLAPQTSGIHEKDVANCLELAERALFIVEQTLNKAGSFITKLFEGADVDDFIKEVGRNFKIVKRYRPQAIRKGSREFYLVAKDFINE